MRYNLSLAVSALLLCFAQPALAASLSTADWEVLSGTGTLSNVTEAVPGLGAATVLSAATAEGTGFSFVQANRQSLNQPGRYVRLQLKSTKSFVINVRVRGTDGNDYYLNYASYARPATVEGQYVKLSLAADYPARKGVYTTLTLDAQGDLARMLPGVDLNYIRWVALRGPMNLGSLEVLASVDYLTSDDDGDGLTGAAEDALGTSPFLFDTDGDQIADGLEAGRPCGAPLDPAVPAALDTDPDGDGINTRVEMFLGTDCNATSLVGLAGSSNGWEPFDPAGPALPGTVSYDDVDHALVLDHPNAVPIAFRAVKSPLRGPLRMPGNLYVARDQLLTSIKAAERFFIYVHVEGSDGLNYYLAYSPDTGAPSAGGNYVVYPLGSLGYSFSGASFTIVARNLSSDLSAMVPGVTVSRVRFVTLRGRMRLQYLNLDGDTQPPVVSNLAVSPAWLRSGQSAQISFDVNEPLGANPAVTVGGVSAAFMSKVGATYTYVFNYDGVAPEGPAAVAVQATDTHGNVGTAAGALNLDKTPPAVAGAIAIAPATARAGQTLTIQFTATEPLTTGTGVTVAGNAASLVAVTGATYTYGYAVLGTEPEGDQPVAVTLVDRAGYTANDAAPVTFDFTPPGFGALTVSKNPAKLGDVLVLTFASPAPLAANPTVTVGGGAAVFLAVTGATYTYRYTVDGTELGGPLTAININGSDAAGNTGTHTEYMALDFDAPTFAGLAPAFPRGTTGSTIVFSVDESESLVGTPTATVGLLGTAVYVGKTGATHTFSFQLWGGEAEGAHTITMSGADAAGNLGSSDVGALTVDYHPPIINPAAVSPLTAKQGDTVTITFTLGEAVPALPQVTVDGLAASLVTQAGNDFTFTYTLSGLEGNGILPVRIRAADPAGNVGERVLGLMINAAPLVSLTNPAGGAAGVTVTTDVRVQFNEPMDGATLDATSFAISGGAAVGTVSYNAATRVAQFQLTAPNTLDYDTEYTVTLSTAIKDATGVALAAPYVFTFRTAALGMASIAGTIATPPAWVRPKVREATGNHLGTISGGSYQISVDRRPDNFVFAWDDLNDDDLWQPGEERLTAYDCNWPGGPLWSTLGGSVNNAAIGYKKITGMLVAPGAWNAAVIEEATGNRAAIGAETYEITVDRAENRHLYVFDDANADGLRQPGETAIRSAMDPLSTCSTGFTPLVNFGIRAIAGRVTEPVAPFLDMIASSPTLDGAFTYAPLQGPMRDYTVYADVAYSTTNVWAFDDANANGALDPGETRIPVSANPVNLTAGDVTGAYIFRRQISGSVAAAPAGWNRPRVAQTGDGNAVDVPAAGGAYAIWVPARPGMTLSWFNDVNNNYRLDYDEPSLRYPVPLNTVYGDLTGINFTGACSISGSFTPPGEWAAGYVFARAEAVTYGTSLTAPVTGGFFTVGVQPAASQIRLLAYEDTNRDGRFTYSVDRNVGYESNDFSNVGNCAQARNFVVSRTVSGTAAVPPGWLAPKVQAYSTASLDPSNNTTSVAGGTYTLRVAAAANVNVIFFDDRNGNLLIDAQEQSLLYASSLNTLSANQTANFLARTISGTAGVPISAVHPKVYANNVWAALGGGGSFVLNVHDASHLVMLWDDVDDDNQVDGSGEPIYGYAGTDTTLGDVTLNFNLRTIEGRVTPPPSWTAALVDIDAAQSFGVAADGKYVAYVVDGWHSVRMFDDRNGNGRFDWGEPSASYPNAVEVAGASVLGINIGYPTISGTVQVPPTFVNPLVTTLFGPESVVPVAPVGASFALPAYYGFGLQLAVFDDLNGTGLWEWGEPVLRHPTMINVNGDVSGVAMTYRTVRGTVNFPPSWSRPGIYAQGGMGPVNGVVTAGNYEVYVEPSMFSQVGMYDDVALQGAFTWSDPSIQWPWAIDTTFGDVNNVDLFYRTIAGSVTAGTTAGWLRPRVEAAGGVPMAEMLSGPAFALYVSPWNGPYTVGVYDDFDLSGAKNVYEPGRAYHTGLGCPAATVDVTGGDVLGIVIDSGCVY